MPLLDHFRPPLSGTRHWEAFHARWASAIADALNDSLPDGYFAEPQVHAGPSAEVDVATFDESSGGTATLTRTQPVLAPPDLLVPSVFPAEFAVRVFETSGGPTLVAAVELVSPANKDRDESRRAFATKCASYLHAGCGLMVVDVVTTRQSRPLDDLLALLDPLRPKPDVGPLTAVAYRPVPKGQDGSIELRIRRLELGEPLAELPLALNAGLVVPLDLEDAYEDARLRSRL